MRNKNNIKSLNISFIIYYNHKTESPESEVYNSTVQTDPLNSSPLIHHFHLNRPDI